MVATEGCPSHEPCRSVSISFILRGVLEGTPNDTSCPVALGGTASGQDDLLQPSWVERRTHALRCRTCAIAAGAIAASGGPECTPATPHPTRKGGNVLSNVRPQLVDKPACNIGPDCCAIVARQSAKITLGTGLRLHKSAPSQMIDFVREVDEQSIRNLFLDGATDGERLLMRSNEATLRRQLHLTVCKEYGLCVSNGHLVVTGRPGRNNEGSRRLKERCRMPCRRVYLASLSLSAS